MLPILCIGEKLEDREEGKTNMVNENNFVELWREFLQKRRRRLLLPMNLFGQLEPENGNPELAQETHAEIRNVLVSLFGEVGESMTIQYGGSMKPENAKRIIGTKRY